MALLSYNSILLLCLFIVSLLPLGVKQWRHFWLVFALFITLEALVIIAIDNELSNPDFDDSAGAAFAGFVALLPGLIFIGNSILRLLFICFTHWKKR